MADTRLIEALRANFEAEREALLTGRLGRLGDLADEREALLDALKHDRGSSADALAALRESAERNRGLQVAAADGIREAMERLRALRAARGPIGGYTETGGARKIGADRASVERKA